MQYWNYIPTIHVGTNTQLNSLNRSFTLIEFADNARMTIDMIVQNQAITFEQNMHTTQAKKCGFWPKGNYFGPQTSGAALNISLVWSAM